MIFQSSSKAALDNPLLGALDGSIHNCMVNRKVVGVGKDGEQLHIFMDNGQVFRISWVDDNGNRIKGEPRLMGIDCKVWAGG